MSIATLVLGPSGTGKSTSMRNLDPAHTLLIQCINKPLPFRSSDWKSCTKEHPAGSVIRTSNTDTIMRAMRGSKKDVIVIDDYQATMVNEMMARSAEKGYDKFTDIAKSAWQLFELAGQLAEHRRVYILAHTQSDDHGQIRMKTVGRMVDEKIVPEGYFTIVLRTEIINGQYLFSTQSNGQDCCKSPIGMFDEPHIPNDLASVDAAIWSYYKLEKAA